jgi:hypothetical protein
MLFVIIHLSFYVGELCIKFVFLLPFGIIQIFCCHIKASLCLNFYGRRFQGKGQAGQNVPLTALQETKQAP